MKASLLTIAVIAATAIPLAACESTNAGQSANRSAPREIYVSGQSSGDRVVAVPQDRSSADSQAPYALRGDDQRPTRNDVSNSARSGTNGGY